MWPSGPRVELVRQVFDQMLLVMKGGREHVLGAGEDPHQPLDVAHRGVAVEIAASLSQEISKQIHKEHNFHSIY